MAVKKTAVAKTAAKKAPAKAATKVGDAYTCGECGLVVAVDEVCDCAGACDIICCDTPMKKRRAKK